MLKPIRWQTFGRDMLMIQAGFALFGISIALMIRANLGVGAWSVLDVALSQITRLTPGTMTVAVGFTVLAIAMLLREQVGWGTLANILSIGPWEDLFLYLIPSIKNNLALQIAMLLGAILIQGIASAVYIGVEAGAGPRDSLMLSIKRTTGLAVGWARGAIELSVVLVGWLLGGPAGIGTVAFALLIGPAVQTSFKIFHVHPHEPIVAEEGLD
ncbi:MAG: hypothetical protein HYR70_08680 [Chloroflexi bacterium]|nr:hypothetical protein [Chloroflexota bacterium]MBI3339095.1 hypothetical protein [Chloroflexota bacterium]